MERDAQATSHGPVWFARSVAAGVLLAALVLAGPLPDNQLLESVLPGHVAAKAPYTAIGLALASLALWLLEGRTATLWQQRVVLACSLVVAALGAVSLAGYLLGTNLGIDQRPFREPTGAVGTTDPGRMAPFTAVNLMLLGTALWWLTRPRALVAAQAVGVLIAGISVLNLIGYLYGAEEFCGFGSVTSMATLTAAAFAALGLGVFCVRPDSGPMRIVTSDTAGGVVARRLLLPAVLIPMAFEWLRLQGRRAGLLDQAFAGALTAVVSILVLETVVWWTARLLERGGGERQWLQHALRQANRHLERRVLDRTAELEQSEQALRRSLELLDQTGQLAKVGGWELRLDTQTLIWTKEVYRIHEVDPAIKPTVADAIQFYVPEARPVITAAVQATIDAGTPFDLELPLITARGRHIWIRALGEAERRGGQTTRLYGALQDITERKRAEETEARLVAILEATPDLVSIADPKGQLVYLNRAGRKMLGIDASRDLTGYNLQEFHDAANVQVVLTDGIPTAMRDGAWSGDTELVALDGHAIAISQVILAHNAPDGTAAFLSTIARDITERRRAELALKEHEETLRASEGRLRQAQHIAHIGSWELDSATGHLWWSEEVFRIFELDPTEFGASYEAFLSAIHPDDRDWVNTAYTGSLEKHAPYKITHRLLMADGRIKFVEECCETDYASDGTPLRSRGTTQDVTERVLVDESRRLQSAALHAASNAIIITDRAGIIEWVNPAFTQITGYTAEDTLGKNPRDLVKSGKHAPAFYKDFWETILNGRPWHGEMINRRKDGTLYSEDQAVTPILDASGAITHFVAIKKDITERLKLEAQFRQAQKMESVGRLASGIAHDFNNLLTVINGMSDLVLAHVSQDDPVHADVQEIHRAGERAATLTRQLLAFSRQQILEPRVLNFNTVVAGMENLLRRLLGEDVDLVVVPTPGLGSVKADPGQIEQVIANLAVNARDAMPQGGQLTIETQNVTIDEDYARLHGAAVPPGAYVLLAVSDSGVGMDETTRARIFEPFFTTKGPGKGTGLGLSTVYGIVKQSNGFVWVYSEVGQGTSFRIYLPQVTEAADTNRSGLTVVSKPGTETILLVEDDAGLREVATRLLEPAGYTVLGAATGEEALRLLERNEEPVHLLLSDVVMPGMSGRHLAEWLAQTRPGMKVLYMSGYTGDTVVRHGVLEAQVPFLSKPFTAAGLLRKVREVLDSKT